jgi:glycosyltransferase involved in cell wall biosynthesis
MIKILFIMNTSGIIGGGQISLLELLRHLDRNEFSPCAIVGAPGELLNSLQNLGIPCSVVPLPKITPANFLRSIGSVISLRRFIKANNVNLVHSNDSRAHFYAGIAARIAMVPSIFHFRVSDSDGWYDSVLPYLATRIVAVSHATGRRFNHFQKKLDIIYNGVDTARFSPDAPLPLDLPLPRHHSPIIGTVGRVGHQKGIDVLIRAAKVLIKDFPELGVLIAGKDEQGEEGKMKNLCRESGLENHVLFLDQWDNMPGFMRRIDLYVLLSENEGFNRSLLEAMACGKAVVATDVGGNPEIVNDRVGRLVPFGNPETTADAIRTLLFDDSLRVRYGLAGRETITQNFSIVRHVQQMSTLFSRLAK